MEAPRWTSWGWLSTSSEACTAAAGTPEAWRSASQSAAGRVRNAAAHGVLVVGPVRAPCVAVAEPRILGERLEPGDRCHQCGETGVEVHDRLDEEASTVGGFEHHRRRRVEGTGAVDAAQPLQQAFGKAQIDVRALAGALAGEEGGEHGRRGVGGAGDVGDLHRHGQSGLAVDTGEIEQPGERLHRAVDGGELRHRAVTTEARDGARHESRVAPAQHLRAEIEARHDAGTEVLDEGVHVLDQLQQDLAAGLALEVEHHRPAVAVECEPVRRRRTTWAQPGSRASDRRSAARS